MKVPTLETICFMKIGVKRFVNCIDSEGQEIISRIIVPLVLKSNFKKSYKKLWCLLKTKSPRERILEGAKMLFRMFKRLNRTGRMDRRMCNLLIVSDGYATRRVKHIKELRQLNENEWVGRYPETEGEKFERELKKRMSRRGLLKKNKAK